MFAFKFDRSLMWRLPVGLLMIAWGIYHLFPYKELEERSLKFQQPFSWIYVVLWVAAAFLVIFYTGKKKKEP